MKDIKKERKCSNNKVKDIRKEKNAKTVKTIRKEKSVKKVEGIIKRKESANSSSTFKTDSDSFISGSDTISVVYRNQKTEEEI